MYLDFSTFFEKHRFPYEFQKYINNFWPSVLHLDEIDVVGVCGSQRHCSIRSAASVCKSRRDCKTLSENLKHFFDSLKDLALNERRLIFLKWTLLIQHFYSDCWIDENRSQIEGALASRKMNSFFDAKIIHAVIWPGLGFSTSILVCKPGSTFKANSFFLFNQLRLRNWSNTYIATDSKPFF